MLYDVLYHMHDVDAFHVSVHTNVDVQECAYCIAQILNVRPQDSISRPFYQQEYALEIQKASSIEKAKLTEKTSMLASANRNKAAEAPVYQFGVGASTPGLPRSIPFASAWTLNSNCA